MCQGSAAAFGVPSWEQPPPPSATDGSVPSVTSLRLPGCTWGATATHLAPHPGLGAVPPCVSAIAFCLSFQPWLPVRLSPPCPRCLGGGLRRVLGWAAVPHAASSPPGAGIPWVGCRCPGDLGHPQTVPVPPPSTHPGSRGPSVPSPCVRAPGVASCPRALPVLPLVHCGRPGAAPDPPKMSPSIHPGTVGPRGSAQGVCVCVGGWGVRAVPSRGAQPSVPSSCPKGAGGAGFGLCAVGTQLGPPLGHRWGGSGGAPGSWCCLGGGVGGC